MSCCCSSNFKCRPCLAACFYDPMTWDETTPKDLYAELLPMYALSECQYPYNQALPVFNFITEIEIAKYSDYGGDVVCPTGTIVSNFSFNLERNPSDNLQFYCGSGNYVNYPSEPAPNHVNCFGNPDLVTDVKVAWGLQPVPNGVIDADFDGAFQGTMYGIYNYNDIFASVCFDGFSFCSLDGCASGHTCVAVPYCATKLTQTWDSFYGQGLATFYTEPCGDQGGDVCVISPYTLCETSGTGGDGLAGTSTGWVIVDSFSMSWDNDEMKYQVNATCGGRLNSSLYVALPPSYELVCAPGPPFCWETTLYNLPCIDQEINLCTTNTINLHAEVMGIGGYITNPAAHCGSCPKTCGCYDYVLPPKYPIEPLNISFNASYVFASWNGIAIVPYYTTSFSASFTALIDYKWSNSPPFCHCDTSTRGDGVWYAYQCIGNGIAVPVEIGVCTDEDGCFPSGMLAYVPLEAVSLGFGAGFGGDGDPVSSTIVNGPLCASSAQTTLNFDSRTCDELNQDAPPSVPLYCFDAMGNVTGRINPWEDPSDCPHGDGETYYTGVGAEYTFAALGFLATSTIDLCNGIISINLYAPCGSTNHFFPSGFDCAGAPNRTEVLVGTMEI